MNCYCGHPKERYLLIDVDISKDRKYRRWVKVPGGECAHCVCKEYAEQSEKEQTLESEIGTLGKLKRNMLCGEDIYQGDIVKPQEEPYSRRDHVHCPEKDSPCGMKGKHRCCLCGKEPQEEPKKSDFDGCRSCGTTDPNNHGELCYVKESESKEGKCPYGCVHHTVLGDCGKCPNPCSGDYIVLEKPKGMSIGVAIAEFTNWNPTKDEIYYTIPDTDLLKLWQEWCNSLEK